MSVSSISSSAASYDPADSANQFQQVRKDFKTLSDALNSGDVATAQQAFATLQKDLPPSASGSGTSSGPLSQLASALKSGDVSGAQQALAQLRQGHHGHHHHAAPAATSDATTSTNDPTETSSGTVLNTLA